MEDNSWKSIIWATAASITLLLTIFIAVSSKTLDFSNLSPPEYGLQFTNSSVIGWNGTKKEWEIKAQSGWVSRNQMVTVLEKIIRAVVYQDRQVIIRNIKANTIQLNRGANEIEAQGTPLYGEIDLARATSAEAKRKVRFTKFYADRLKYFGNKKETDSGTSIRKCQGLEKTDFDAFGPRGRQSSKNNV